MAESASGLARAGVAAAALVVGAAGGWLAGKAASRTPPAPPPVFANPLADAKVGESLALRRRDGAVELFRVLEADPLTLLLQQDTQAEGAPFSTRQLRVSRSWFGGFLILEGDADPAAAAANLRDVGLLSVEPDTQVVEALGRPVRCWKFTVRHRVFEKMVIWVSDEIPVHGVVRIDTAKEERMFLYHGSGAAR
jgi:hypothetical protein